MAAPSLLVTSVLYGNSREDVSRGLAALAHATRLAQQAGLLGDVSVRLGDCSPEAVFDDDSLTGMVGPHRDAIAVGYQVFGENLGSAAGHNRLEEGFAQDLRLVLNPDVVVAPTVLIELVRGLDDPAVGVVEARQLPFEHPKDYDHATGDTSWASTCCCLVRGDTTRQLGGFDARSFFLYCDDVDYAWRARLAGWRVVYRPTARVFHDKRLAGDGRLSVGWAEEFYSAEAGLMLARKYSRPDLVRQFARSFEQHGSPVQKDALASFRAKEAAGLPAPVDPKGAVAEFVEGNYARHRF